MLNRIKILFATGLILISVGCSSAKKTKLDVGLLYNLDAVPFIIAKQQGYLDDSITLTKFASAQDRDSAFQSGSLDGHAADVLAACFAKEGGIGVAVTSLTEGRFMLMSNIPGGEIEGIKGVAGHSVAISKNTIIEFTLDSMLQQFGIDITSVEKVMIPQIPSRLEMLQQGKVDMALFPEPFASASALSGAVTVAEADEMGIVSGIMMFTTDSIENKKMQISGLYEAYNKAADYLNSTPRSEYIDFIVTELKFPESATDVIKIPRYAHAKLPDEKIIDAAVSWLFDRQLIENKYSYDSIVDKSFAPLSQ